MSPSGAELHPPDQEPDRRGRSLRGPRAARTATAWLIVDVRETDEFEAGHLPGAMHVPRGHLESRIEGAVPDRSHARDPLLRLGQPLGARRAHAAASSSATRTSSR